VRRNFVWSASSTFFFLLALKATAAAADNCDNIPGVWSWFTGGDVTFNRNGTLTQGALTGNWVCTNSRVVIEWSHHYVDNLLLSTGGNHLEGTNNVNSKVWGNLQDFVPDCVTGESTNRNGDDGIAPGVPGLSHSFVDHTDLHFVNNCDFCVTIFLKYETCEGISGGDGSLVMRPHSSASKRETCLKKIEFDPARRRNCN
jgi:hypothetical protein